MSWSSTISLSKAEKAYIQAGLVATPPSRADGRDLLDYRSIALETGVAPLANGSARVCIGRSLGGADTGGAGGGTEVVTATKLEVENVGGVDGGVDGGRVVCSVSCSPSAYPHHTSSALEDLQHDLTSLLHTTLAHPSLRPENLGILQGRKAWLLNVDVLVLAAEAGNVADAVFVAARAALWDTRVPRTRGVEYRAPGSGSGSKGGGGKGKGKAKGEAEEDGNPRLGGMGRGDMDVDEETPSGFDTRRQVGGAVDFELPDYWDEGEVLAGRERWPVCVTLNLEPPIYYLDASAHEETATVSRLLLMFSFPSRQNEPADVRAVRLLGPGEVQMEKLQELIKIGETHARGLFNSLDVKLRDEDLRRNQKARERFERHR